MELTNIGMGQLRRQRRKGAGKVSGVDRVVSGHTNVEEKIETAISSNDPHIPNGNARRSRQVTKVPLGLRNPKRIPIPLQKQLFCIQVLVLHRVGSRRSRLLSDQWSVMGISQFKMTGYAQFRGSGAVCWRSLALGNHSE